MEIRRRSNHAEVITFHRLDDRRTRVTARMESTRPILEDVAEEVGILSVASRPT
ncbi:hypothetical protein B0E55_05216 [Rhodococcus sp. 66b]|nr:hypothetical protein B0E55_05216 [Rhodococcus sp. 66b]